jgi:uncharacterized membrane protein
MTRPDHFLPLTTDHFTAIGRVAMEWSVIKGYIAFLVRVLVDNNKRIGMTMTVNLQSPAGAVAISVGIRFGAISNGTRLLHHAARSII